MARRHMTPLQEKVMDKLKAEGKLFWTKIPAKEVTSLTSLVRKGLVAVKGLTPSGNYYKETYWELKK